MDNEFKNPYEVNAQPEENNNVGECSENRQEQPCQSGYAQPPYENSQSAYTQPQAQYSQNQYAEPQYQNTQNVYAQPQYQNPQNTYTQPQYQNTQNTYAQPQYQNTQNAYAQPQYPNNQGGYTQGYGVSYVTYVKPKVPGKGFGITSMIMGIAACVYGALGVLVSVMMSFLGSVAYQLNDSAYYSQAEKEATGAIFSGVSGLSLLMVCVYVAVFAILALIFSFVARSRGYKNGISKAGLIMGGIGAAICVIGVVAGVMLLLTASV